MIPYNHCDNLTCVVNLESLNKRGVEEPHVSHSLSGESGLNCIEHFAFVLSVSLQVVPHEIRDKKQIRRPRMCLASRLSGPNDLLSPST